jgi:uncharacterized membrane protein YbhN (UPF0104 family)
VSHTLRQHVGAAAHRHRRPAWRRHLGRVLTVGFLLLVAGLVVNRARQIDWGAVRDALLAYPAGTLAAAAGLAALSYGVYACYDLIGRRYVRHKLATRKVMGVALVSYAFNLNLGTLIGAVGLRWRLYSRLGLRQAQIGRVVGLSVLTNWSGYLLLAGLLFTFRQLELPVSWPIGNDTLQAIGVVMVSLAVAYVTWCKRARRRQFSVRGHAFKLPSAYMAGTQLAVSATNWSLMGLLVWLLLPEGPRYPIVLATLMTAAVAGLVVRVPAGLGVIEAVFVGVLGGLVAEGPLIAALLVYRAVYYLVPLSLAAALHFGLEASARRRRMRSTTPPKTG